MAEILSDAHMQQIEKPTEAGAGMANQSITNAPTLSGKYRGKTLGLYIVVNLGPRGSKGKVIKIERN